MAESVSNGDDDGDGISNNKDNNTAINKIQVDTGKTITSLTGTRILLGAMGKDSSRLTPGIAIEMVLAITPLALPVLSICSPSVSFAPPSLIVNLRQVAPVVNPAFQVLLSVQFVLVLEWIVLLVLTSKLAQPVTNEYLRNSAFAGIADGEQADNTGDANGVVASTISITVPDLEDPMDPPSSGGSSGGGCVYNPNANIDTEDSSGHYWSLLDMTMT
jgi:hypothetical protein